MSDWINNNLWITNSETYKNGEYNIETIPKLNCGFAGAEGNSISSVNELNTFLDYWKLYEPYPRRCARCLR